MKHMALIGSGAVVDVRPENEVAGVWPEGSDVRELPPYASLGWIPDSPDWRQPDGSPATARQLRYVVPALVFARRLTPDRAMQLWSMAGTVPGVALFLFQFAALRDGIESDHPGTVAAMDLATQLWGLDAARSLFGRPTTDEIAELQK